MINKKFSMVLVCMLVTGGLLIVTDIGSQNARATDVSGTVYDGSGGPWTLAGSPYYVKGDILVPAGETLTIDPGVEVRFDGFFMINVQGNLTAVGTPDQMINITSNSTTPAIKDWDRIQIDFFGHADMAYCNISYADFAIWVYEDSNNITYNNISNNQNGIYFVGSSNNRATDNNISNNLFGVIIMQSTGNNLSGNTMINNGIYFYGDQLEQWNSHYIDTSNTVNGKPVYYVTNQTGGTVPLDAGQIILANCTGMLIENHVITNTTVAIQLGFSSNNNIISHNTVSNSTYGILMAHSNSNTLSNNTAISNNQGIAVSYSDLNSIMDNNCSYGRYGSGGAMGSGIRLDDSTGNNVFNNTCINNYRAGVELSFRADGNYIFENNCSFNHYGLYCYYASNNEWHNNTCDDNTGYGLRLSGDSIGNSFKDCSFISNGEYGMELRDGSLNTISNNEINWNVIYGVYITSAANNNTIIYNDINNNTDYGIYAEAPDNIIHHNNIAYNNGSSYVYDPAFIQAYDDSTNTWNTSDKGNWWADWTTPDILAPFGIVDNPYVLDGGGQDNFPLVNPVDAIPPMIFNLQPADGVAILVNTTTIAANYTDAAGINTTSVTLDVDGFDVTSFSTVGPDGVFYDPGAPFADGTHTINLTVADIHGNLAVASWTFTVDTIPPSIMNKQPIDGSITSDNMTTIRADYSDAEGIDTGLARLWVDGNGETSNATITANNITFIPMTPLSEGPHTVEISVWDLSGWNTAQIWFFTVDAVPPVIFNMLPLNGTTLMVNITTISANYTDAEGINVSTVVLKINGGDITSSAIVEAEGITYTTPTALTDGIYVVELEVKNIHDNPANATWTFIIDTTAPDITNLQPADASSTSDDSVTIGANFTDLSGIDMGSIVLLVDGSDETLSAAITADGISFDPAAPWSEGPHTIELRINDTLGNAAVLIWSFEVDTTPPEDITDLAASDPTTESIVLTWTAPGDDGGSGTAAEYEVKYSTSGEITDANWNSAYTYSQSWTPLAAGETESYMITGLDSETQYWFAIRAVDEVSNTGGASNSPDATTLVVTTAPEVPENLELEWGDSYVHLTWEAPASDGNSPITNYIIYRGTSSSSIPFLIEIGNVLTYNDTTPTNGIRYYYKVSAKNAVGEGLQTNRESATPAALPSAPQNMQVSVGVGYVEITWDAPADDGGLTISNYVVYRGNASGQTVFLTQLSRTVLVYNDTDVEAGVTYYYIVRAKTSLGEGAESTEISGTPTSPPNLLPDSEFTSLSAGQVLEGTVNITGTASDPEGALVRVEMKIDDGSWFTVTGTDTWSHELDTTTLSNGDHMIYIRSYDGLDYSAEDSVTVEVSNPEPKEDKTLFEEAWFFPLIIIVIIIIVLLLLMMMRKKPPEEGMPEEEDIPPEGAPEEGEEEPSSEEEQEEEPMEEETSVEEPVEEAPGEELTEEPGEEAQETGPENELLKEETPDETLSTDEPEKTEEP